MPQDLTFVITLYQRAARLVLDALVWPTGIARLICILFYQGNWAKVEICTQGFRAANVFDFCLCIWLLSYQDEQTYGETGFNIIIHKISWKLLCKQFCKPAKQNLFSNINSLEQNMLHSVCSGIFFTVNDNIWKKLVHRNHVIYCKHCILHPKLDAPWYSVERHWKCVYSVCWTHWTFRSVAGNSLHFSRRHTGLTSFQQKGVNSVGIKFIVYNKSPVFYE